MNELMNYEDFQREAELEFQRHLARKQLYWIKDVEGREPDPSKDYIYFEIPTFIREQVEKEQEVKF